MTGVSGGMPSPIAAAHYSPPALDNYLPSAILSTILSRLDVRSICSAAAACRSLRFAAEHTISFITSIDLLEIMAPVEVLRPLLPPNPHLRSLRLDCGRLDDFAVHLLARPSLQEMYLINCDNLSGLILSELGAKCPQLRSLSLSSLAERKKFTITFSDLEKLLCGCSQLESLGLVFDTAAFEHSGFCQAWGAAQNLKSLQFGYIPLTLLTELLTVTMESHRPPYHVKPPLFPSLQKLCLSVDYITDSLVIAISEGLASLTHLDLLDAPIIEPIRSSDLTNTGLQQINSRGKLKHISLIRSQEFLFTYFRRVNDLGVLLMSDTCASLESISLGGFCRVTDTGFRAILHSCTLLRKLRVSHGSHLTDLVFHDISATSLSLTHVSLRWCNLLTNHGIVGLSSNKELNVLDIRDCRNFSDGALRSLSSLHKLQVLLLDGTDISDAGLSYLASGVCPLISLSIRGCRRLTDKCISYIFTGSFAHHLQVLDLSRIPNISDNGIFAIARSRVPIMELRMRECPLIGDTAVMALASMQVDGGSYGSSLFLLDLYESGGITPRAIQWFKKPYFPRLRWLGVTGSLNRDMVDGLARTRPFLHVACRGEEVGIGYWDSACDWYRHEDYEVDELEQWLLEGREYDVDMELN